MGADVHNESALAHLDLIGAKQEQHVERSERGHLRRIKPARVRGEAYIERADPRSRVVQNRKAVPAFLDGADINRKLGRRRKNRPPVMPASGARADQNNRIFSVLQHLGEGMLAGGDIAERVGSTAEVIVAVGQIEARADHAGDDPRGRQGGEHRRP